ncbi:hypothetical protein Xvie_04023 [Xenorhabdus vietnamensis]|uniref:Uncharacterized protein n=1 Tax=Xenorhabdus vietnamensis TaxID=351656 RepID=A0A1Y2S612_9GAMM|nr:hypothetical protein Xvie_04023 [Xenorhabdus vietnamensis]
MGLTVHGVKPFMMKLEIRGQDTDKSLHFGVRSVGDVGM